LIKGYVIIRDHTIILDGARIFSEKLSLGEFLLRAYDHLKIDYPKFYKMDNLSRLGFLAAELLLREHPIDAHSYAETAVVLSNSNSSLDSDLKYLAASKKMASPALFVYTLPNIVVGEICIRHRIKGENAFFVSKQFDPDLLTDYVDMLFQSDAAQACLAGWVDVLEEHHDVLLYLAEKRTAGTTREEADRLWELYKKEIWNN
jgi:hypothetical protein